MCPRPRWWRRWEFTVPRADYEALGGHAEAIRSLDSVLAEGGAYGDAVRRIGAPR
jgi:hypothetical protein